MHAFLVALAKGLDGLVVRTLYFNHPLPNYGKIEIMDDWIHLYIYNK